MTARRGRGITRRGFAVTAGCAFATAAFGESSWVSAQIEESEPGDDNQRPRGEARLSARPRAGVTTSLKSGPIGLGSERDGLIQMPSRAPDSKAGKVPLLVFLHGAGQRGAGLLQRIGREADEAGVAVVAPDSRGVTWDGIRGLPGEDVAFLNRVLESVFERVAVDPARVAIGGFSDGATYALSLGLANGDLFPRVVAYSPGFVIPLRAHGKPRFFISHGTADKILPIAKCSRVIVRRLRASGYDVTFRQFDGGHTLPPEIVDEGTRWMATGSARAAR